MKNVDYVIVGAGLSGLACAITLKRANLSYLIVEAQSEVGGRVASQETADGFIIDQGFQVLLNSYPELGRFVDLNELKLKRFNAGALIYNGKNFSSLGNPLVHPQTLPSILTNEFVSLKDALLTIKLILESQKFRNDSPLGSLSTLEFLNQFGFSKKFIENFWRPFLTGVYLDPELSLGSDYFQFLIRSFCWGQVSIPSLGMKQLPLKMKEQLSSNTIRLNCPINKIFSSSVELYNGEKIQAQKVICTYDQNEIAPSKSKISLYRSVTTYYFTSPSLKNSNWGKWLVLIPRRFGLKIDHFCLISSISESYTKTDPVISVSVVADKKHHIDEIINELNQLAGKNLNLKHIETTFVERALPRMDENQQANQDGWSEKEGIYYCGDKWTSPSINGALRSGRLLAEHLISLR